MYCPKEKYDLLIKRHSGDAFKIACALIFHTMHRTVQLRKCPVDGNSALSDVHYILVIQLLAKSRSSTWHASSLHHGSILFLESLTKTFRTLQVFIDAAHDTVLLSRDK